MANAPTRMGGAADAFQQGFRQAGNTVNAAMNMMQRQRELNEMARQADQLHLREVGKSNLNLLKEFAKNSPAGALGFVKDNPAFLSGLLSTINPTMTQQQHGQAMQQIMDSMIDPQSMMKEMASLYYAVGGTDKFEIPTEQETEPKEGVPEDFTPMVETLETETFKKEFRVPAGVRKGERDISTTNVFWKFFKDALTGEVSPDEIYSNMEILFGRKEAEGTPDINRLMNLMKGDAQRYMRDLPLEEREQQWREFAANYPQGKVTEDKGIYTYEYHGLKTETPISRRVFKDVTVTNRVDKPIGKVEDGKWKLDEKEVVRGIDMDKILESLRSGSGYPGDLNTFKAELYESYLPKYPGKYDGADDFLKKNLSKIAKDDGLQMPLIPEDYENEQEIANANDKFLGREVDDFYGKYLETVEKAFDEDNPKGFEKRMIEASGYLGRHAKKMRDLGPMRWMRWANGVVNRMGGSEVLRRTASPLELEMVKLLAQVTLQDREFQLDQQKWLDQEGIREAQELLIKAQTDLAYAQANAAFTGRGGQGPTMDYVIAKMKQVGSGPYAMGDMLADPIVRMTLVAASEAYARTLGQMGIDYKMVEKKFRTSRLTWFGGGIFGGRYHEKLMVPEISEVTPEQRAQAIEQTLQNLTPAQRAKYGTAIANMQ